MREPRASSSHAGVAPDFPEPVTSGNLPTSPPGDPDAACEHPEFVARVDVDRITHGDDDPTIIAFGATLTINCVACNEVFRFIGMDAGLLPNRPMCSVDESEARLPIRPASSDPDFGLGIPGFAVKMRERHA